MDTPSPSQIGLDPPAPAKADSFAQRSARRRKRRAWLFVLAATFLFLIGPWPRSWTRAWNRRLAPDPQTDALDAIDHSAALLPCCLETGPLRAGCARTNLSDGLQGGPLAGYAERAFLESGPIADPLWAKALVLENGRRRVAIVTADLLLFNRALSEAVLKSLRARDDRWGRADVYFGATHTHSAPGGYAGRLLESIGLGLPDRELTNRLADRVAQSILLAAASVRPSTMSSVCEQVRPELIRNRTKADDPPNRWLDLLVVRQAGTQNLTATVISFGAHATARHSENMGMSGDYPGVACREVEAALGGRCLFLAGAVGSMAPPNQAVQRAELSEWLGKQLADEAIEAVGSADSGRSHVVLESLGCWLPLPPPEIKLGPYLRFAPFVSGRLLPRKVWVHGLRIGDRVYLGTPADYSGPLAEQLRRRATGVTTVVTSFNGDYIGYVLPDSYDELPKYEPRSMSFYGPRFGDYFQASLTDLAGRLTR